MRILTPLLALVSSILFPPQLALAQAGSGDYSIAERGPNHRVWQHVGSWTNELGVVTYATNSYTELATGMHYQDPKTGQWLESQEVIEGFPGGAIARQGQIQMIFPNDLSAEPIEAQTSAGRFRSAVVCLSYADYGLQTNLIIAEIQPCQGEIVAPNQVLYPAAFSNNVSASIRYTYRKCGWEQDIVINDPGTLPTPESLGLDSSSPTLTLQVTTEFLEAPPPNTRQVASAAAGPGLEDQAVDWGAIRLGQGQALFLGPPANAKPVATVKRWVVTADGRQFLVEEVLFGQLLKTILSKPGGASLDNAARKVRSLASLDRLPRLKRAKPNPRRMELASTRPPERGLLIDYVTMTGSTNNFTFQCDSIYYVSGLLSLSGTTVCEGGTVIKFTNTPTAKISMSGPLQCKAGPYRPIIMTSKDDDSIGAQINGSTSSPTNYNGATYLEDNNSQTNTYQYLRLSYAGIGLSAAIFSNGVRHCQFVKCGTAVNATGPGQVTLRNVLISQCTNGVITTGSLSAEHLTADQCTTLLVGSGSSGVLTNSLLTAVAAVTNVSLYSSVNLSGGSGVYQTVGAAGYYLADGSTNRNAGTTNINSTLLSDLALRTTYAPIVVSNTYNLDATLSPQAQRDTDIPDLGYHYDPLDYVVSSFYVTNTLLLTNGVAVGTCAGNGLIVYLGGTLLSQGSPCRMNALVRYNVVQEQSNTNWVQAVNSFWGGSSFINVYGEDNTGTIQCSFTLWSIAGSLNVPGSAGLEPPYHVYGSLLGGIEPQAWYSHCQFTGGAIVCSDANPVAFTNCLCERVSFLLIEGENPIPCYLYNNLFFGGTLNLASNSTNPSPLFAFDNLFDRTTFDIVSVASVTSNGYNGYVTNYTMLPNSQGNDVILTNSPVYQTSYLGSYYYPTNDGVLSTLIDAGSRWATNAGLYQFTTTTNQVKEGATKVDIGYHYVAVDPKTGLPYDYDGDGIPDYLEDTNGDGVYDAGDLSDWKTYNSPNGLTAGNGLQVFTPLK
jgi:hypothetical protein